MLRLLIAALLFSLPGSAATLFRIACGGPGGTDPAGNVWTPDTLYASSGALWTTAGSPTTPYNRLRYSSPPGSPFSISLSPGPGQYTVTLKFQEPNKTAAGQRIFSVSINGQAMLTNLDLFAAAGLQPIDYPFPVMTGADGKITVSLTASPGSNAVISGIQIDGQPPAVPPAYTSGPGASIPAACPPGPLQFYWASDTQMLMVCLAPGPWVAVSLPAVHAFACTGTGSLDSGASCAGLYALQVVGGIGSAPWPIVGVAYATLPTAANVVWKEIAIASLPGLPPTGGIAQVGAIVSGVCQPQSFVWTRTPQAMNGVAAGPQCNM
jgi:hypothetical protein